MNVARETNLHDVELRLDDPVLLAQLQLTAQASNTAPQAFSEKFLQKGPQSRSLRV